MHRPPNELNENLYWLGLGPKDLLSIIGVNLISYYILILFRLELASFLIAIGFSVILHRVRRTKREKFLRDYVLNFLSKEGGWGESSSEKSKRI